MDTSDVQAWIRQPLKGEGSLITVRNAVVLWVLALLAALVDILA